MDSPVRRSGIPVPRTKSTPMKKSMSKSSDDLLLDSIEPQSLNTELDVFTLLEENIALKEKQDVLIEKNNLILQKNVQLERENGRVGQQLNDLKVQQKQLKDQLEHLMDKFQREIEDSQTIHNIQEQQKKTIKELMIKVRQQEEKHGDLLKAGKQAKHRLEELAPGIQLMEKKDDENKCDIVTADTVEQLISEISKIKTQMNNTELQLYEANEKIAELIDNQQHLKDENESLKVENSNLTKVAKLVTNSMRESMDTSKRMEGALIEMKRRNDELVQGNRDSIDSPTSPKFFSANDQVLHLKDELKRREAAHSERIVEMSKLMEATIETNNNDEIKILRIKLDVVEKELQLAINRAEKAESELKQLKQSIQTVKIPIENTEMPHDKWLQSQTSNDSAMHCAKCGQSLTESIESTSSARTSIASVENVKPPPIPPPMPNFKIAPIRCGTSLSESIAEFTLNNTPNSQCSEQKKPATGMDALMLELNAELRNGRATLRRNRRQVTGSSAALQEMFQTLELSKKQNRNSLILMESHMQ